MSLLNLKTLHTIAAIGERTASASIEYATPLDTPPFPCGTQTPLKNIKTVLSTSDNIIAQNTVNIFIRKS